MSAPPTPNFIVDGLSVGIVKYPDGLFRQVAPGRRWVEDAHNWRPSTTTFQYAETSRSDAAVLLYDPSRKMNVLLDLDARRVALMAGRVVSDFARAKAAFTTAHRILDASVASDQSMFEITGLTAGLVKCDDGAFRRTGTGQFWVHQGKQGNIISLFRESERQLDAIVLQHEQNSSTIVLDFTARRIRSKPEDGHFKDIGVFTELAMAEPLGVIFTSFFVVKEDDFGDDEELYGRLYTYARGKNVSTLNFEERELYNSTEAVSINEGESYQLTDAKALFYGLDQHDIIYIAGSLKEKDALRDDDLGFSQAAVRIANLNDRKLVLTFGKNETKVEARFHVTRNFFSHTSRPDGFIPTRIPKGLKNVPRFPGVVPMPHFKAKGVAGGVNILPEGPESVSNRLKSVVLFSIGFVPHVGGLLTEVVDMLWPEEEMEAWDEIKGRAEVLMKNLITVERVRDLEKRLKGLKQSLDYYQNTSMGSAEKGSWMVNVLSTLNTMQPFFFDERNPEYMLPYLVTLGTLTLTVMREQIMFYKRIYGRADPDSDYKLMEMKERLEEYDAAVKKALQGATQWRLNLVNIKEEGDKFVVSDELTGYVSKEYGNRPEILFQNISRSLKNTFEVQIEDMSQPATAWKYMLPQIRGLKVVRTLVTTMSGPFPVEKWTAFDENPGGERISRVVLFIDEVVEGMQLWYGDKPGSAHGNMTAGKQERLDLEEDEVIIAASGRSEEVIDAMWIFTSKGRSVGGGRVDKDSYEWTAAPPSPDGYLESIFGVRGGFGFNWKHYRTE